MMFHATSPPDPLSEGEGEYKYNIAALYKITIISLRGLFLPLSLGEGVAGEVA